MSGCVRRIVDRSLVIELPSGDLCKDLSTYDFDGDDVLEASDLIRCEDSVSESSARNLLHDFVVGAFRHHRIINEKQEKALYNYFDLYNRIDELNKIILKGSQKFGKPWAESHINTWGSELEFEPKYWEVSVQPVIEEGGLFSNHFGLDAYEGFLLKPSDLKLRGLGYQLSMALYNTLDDLGGVKKYSFGGGCTSEKAFNEADIKSMPAILQKSAKQMIGIYNEIEEFLNDYNELECEGDGCPDEDEFTIHNLVPFREKPEKKK